MTTTRRLLRWLPTFLAFPLGGLLTVSTVGSLTAPASGLLGGAIAGAVLGGAQWLALRSSGIGRAWWLATAVAVAVGTALGVALTEAGTTTADLVVRGLVTGAATGLVQALAVRRPAWRVAAWTVVTSAAWGVGWLATANVIVDADRGYVVFGASGAVLATLITGVALPLLLGRDGATAGTAATAVTDRDDHAVTR